MDVIPNLWLCGVWLNSSEREGRVLYTYKPCIENNLDKTHTVDASNNETINAIKNGK